MEAQSTPGASSRYRIGSVLGAGGMATVSRAYDTLLQRDVAYKTLAPRIDLDGPARQRLLVEARAAAALVHPNVVAVYDVLVHEGPAIVMEYVSGGSLAALLRRSGPLEPRRALAYARQIASALAAAHDRGILHRDIKPSNILISPDGERVKVADFGIARRESSDELALTQPGRMLGSAQYFSPEQAQGLPLTPASDLYSLGVVLHEMLTGSLPFTATDPIAMAVAHVTEPTPSRETLSRAMPAELAAIVHRLLRKDPAERFTAARDLDAALTAVETGPQRAADAAGFLNAPRAPAARLASAGSDTHAVRPGTEAPDSRSARGTRAESGAPPPHDLPRRLRVPSGNATAFVLWSSTRLTDWTRRATEAFAEHRTALVLTGIAAALVFAIVWAGTRPPAIALADVRHTQVLRARAMLAARGLVTSAVGRTDVAIPEGNVIDQQPIAGTAVHRGDLVRLVVSSGPPLVTVPELRGRNYAEARAALARLPLASTFEGRISEAPADTVLAEYPQPGAHVTPGSAETIVISTGPQPAFDGYGAYDPGAGPPGRRKHGRFGPGAGENGGADGGD